MVFSIFHKVNSNFGVDWFDEKNIPGIINLNDYEKVAEVECDGIEQAYYFTNHIDFEWWEHKNVVLFKKSRSTSVEDIILEGKFEHLNSYANLCVAFGWRKVKIV